MGNKNGVRINKPVNVRNEHTTLWNGIRLTVKSLLSVDEFVSATNRIVGQCIDDDSQKVIIEMFDIAFRAGIISAYSDALLPSNVDDINYIVYETDLFDTVLKNANSKQIAFMRKCIKTLIGM